MTWRRGDHIVLREVWRDRVWSALPSVVVEDQPEIRLLYMPGGTTTMHASDPAGHELRLYMDGEWTMAARTVANSMLSFSHPRMAHAVLAFWDPERRFVGWYINLETPLRPDPLGFAFVDHCLDLVVSADRSSWRWKDEDELDEAIERGIFSPRDAKEFRAEGERVLRQLMDGEPPFDRDWAEWRPDPSWGIPGLPDGWERLSS
jgi:predicted RNA-binding protein associated with RNAse of E/G family